MPEPGRSGRSRGQLLPTAPAQSSALPLQDFLKYSKKASLDTSELEVLSPALPRLPPKQPVPGGWVSPPPGPSAPPPEGWRGRTWPRRCGRGWHRSFSLEVDAASAVSPPAESRGGHVHSAEAVQRHDERRAAAGIRRNALSFLILPLWLPSPPASACFPLVWERVLSAWFSVPLTLLQSD